jgi:hypothetical protein
MEPLPDMLVVKPIPQASLSEKDSAPPLRTRRLCGEGSKIHRRDTEYAEVTQRQDFFLE